MGRSDQSMAAEYKADLLYARKIRDGLVAEAMHMATVALAKGDLAAAVGYAERSVDMAPHSKDAVESLAYLQRLKRQTVAATAAKNSPRGSAQRSSSALAT